MLVILIVLILLHLVLTNLRKKRPETGATPHHDAQSDSKVMFGTCE